MIFRSADFDLKVLIIFDYFILPVNGVTETVIIL